MSVTTAAAAPLSAEDVGFIEQQERTRRSHPENRAALFATRQLMESLTGDQRAMLRRCCQSGTLQLDSEIGCYLLHSTDLRELECFFDPLIRDYHGASSADAHIGGWSLDSPDRSAAMDFSALGLPPLSMRVRVARNLEGFRLPGNMDRDERVRMERAITGSLQALVDDPCFGGRIYSLTPDFGDGISNPHLVTAAEHERLAASHVMFRNMAQDRYMTSAGIAADWPYGRACCVSRDQDVIVWIGEEDHLRVICMKTGARLQDVFERLRQAMAVIEALPGMRFAMDSRFGYITSCPSNLGTGLRASVHIALPGLMRSGVDVRQLCRRVGLSVCGPGGDRTPIVKGGVLEVSPTRRAFIRERDILQKLYDGVRQLATLDAA